MDAQLTGPITIDTPLGDSFTFRSMSGAEGLSRPFFFEVEATCARDDIKPDELLGQHVTVGLQLGDDAGSVRSWDGRVTAMQCLETGENGQTRYRLTLRPWLWALGLAADCRVYQNLSVPDIAKDVFQRRGFTDFESVLFETHTTREYVVQYRETDLHFLSRLFEEEGIYYFFRHEAGKHTLVLADSVQAHAPVSGYESLPFAGDDEHRDETMQYVRRWRAEGQLASGLYTLADFNFTMPRVPLRGSGSGAQEDAESQLEIYDHPGGFMRFEDAIAVADLRLQQARRNARTARGETNARGLTVGATFSLVEHPRDGENAKYLVTSARLDLRGEDPTRAGDRPEEPFACAFAVIDADVAFRPSIAGHKPSVRGPQTATVVGPSGREIWTDEYGRVKVQFHWDRVGQNDENSSCWVRVSQAWAGSGWGAQFIPRIGQEVLVDFLEGDPDRPIITGSVYNGANRPPFDLPLNQTQSGIRTESSPGGSIVNANEIRFEDLRGCEELYVQAEKDMNVLVKNDQTVTVAANRTVSIGVNDQLSVGVNRTQTVGVNETISVGAVQAITVGAAQTVTVGAVQAITVGAEQTVTVGAERDVTIGAKDSIHVGGDRHLDVAADLQQTVGGNVVVETEGKTNQSLGDDYTERHSGHRTIIVGSGSAARTAVLHVEGNARAYASKAVEVEVLKSVTLLCGDSQIIVSPSGITLNSPNIAFVGKEVAVTAGKLTIKTSDALTMTGATVTMQTSGAKVALDSSSAAVTASAIKLGSGSGSSAQSDDKPVKITKVQMKDAQGKPRANARVLLTIGGEERMTVLDADGMLELTGDDSYQVSFPDDLKAK